VKVVIFTHKDNNSLFVDRGKKMNVLDLRSIRCPLALVTLKRHLLSTDDLKNSSLKILFSNESAMADITLYLDKKAYQYQMIKDNNSLIITINNIGKA
jgi:TusA-related sulfurtransferase